jgi:hypothetical protein
MSSLFYKKQISVTYHGELDIHSTKKVFLKKKSIPEYENIKTLEVVSKDNNISFKTFPNKLTKIVLKGVKNTTLNFDF